MKGKTVKVFRVKRSSVKRFLFVIGCNKNPKIQNQQRVLSKNLLFFQGSTGILE